MLVVKNLSASAGDLRVAGSVPESGRSPGGWHGNPLQDSCLENSMAEEPRRLKSIGSRRVRHDRSSLAHTRLTESTVGGPSLVRGFRKASLKK